MKKQRKCQYWAEKAFLLQKNVNAKFHTVPPILPAPYSFNHVHSTTSIRFVRSKKIPSMPPTSTPPHLHPPLQETADVCITNICMYVYSTIPSELREIPRLLPITKRIEWLTPSH